MIVDAPTFEFAGAFVFVGDVGIIVIIVDFVTVGEIIISSACMMFGRRASVGGDIRMRWRKVAAHAHGRSSASALMVTVMVDLGFGDGGIG